MLAYVFVSDWVSSGSGILLHLDYFSDPGVLGTLEMGRMLARFLVIVGVSLASAFFVLGCCKLLFSNGESHKIVQARDILKRVFIGLVLCVSSFVLVMGAVNILVNAIGQDQIVSFWHSDDLRYGFTISDLLGDVEVALEGEVIMLDGSDVVVCADPLGSVATGAGWSWDGDIAGTGLGGCTRS